MRELEFKLAPCCEREKSPKESTTNPPFKPMLEAHGPP